MPTDTPQPSRAEKPSPERRRKRKMPGDFTYLTMRRCLTCRKVTDPDNRVESGHVKLDDGAKVMAARHLKCPAPLGNDKHGCYGPWREWMGILVGRGR